MLKLPHILECGIAVGGKKHQQNTNGKWQTVQIAAQIMSEANKNNSSNDIHTDDFDKCNVWNIIPDFSVLFGTL
jgi:hypothetical protein